MSENYLNKPVFTILNTSRGGEMIYYKNYFYIKYHLGKNENFWRCQNKKCVAKLCTSPLDNIENLIQKNEHNHVLSENEISKLLLAKKIENLAENSGYNTHMVYSIATASTAMSQLPILRKRSIYQNIRNIRKRKSITVDSTKNMEEMKIKTLRGDDFCLFDSGAETSDRIVILGTSKNLCHLKNNNILMADGTFKVCPREFEQLYVFHSKICSKNYPLVYVLMKSKKEHDYLKAFTYIFEKCEFTYPEYIIIDFEVSAYNSFKKTTNSTIYFCLFHFGQCLWRKIQKLGLSGEYLKNIELRLFIKCISSLAFVPTESVELEYTKILKKASDFENEKIGCFLKYFEKNFLKGTKYPITCWNAYNRILQDIPLTSNAAEVFNRHFHGKFEQSHPSITTFIDKIKINQSNVENDIENSLSRREVFSESRNEKKLSQIKIICQNYRSYYELDFLMLIAKLYNWKLD